MGNLRKAGRCAQGGPCARWALRKVGAAQGGPCARWALGIGHCKLGPAGLGEVGAAQGRRLRKVGWGRFQRSPPAYGLEERVGRRGLALRFKFGLRKGRVRCWRSSTCQTPSPKERRWQRILTIFSRLAVAFSDLRRTTALRSASVGAASLFVSRWAAKRPSSVLEIARMAKRHPRMKGGGGRF